MSVEGKVKEILIDLLEVDESEIVSSAQLGKDLEASSVDIVEILAALENEFDIEISDEEASDLLAVDAIVDFVKVKTS
jgi:acyl carrier protein